MSTLQNRITQLSPAKLALLSQRLKEKNSVEADVQSIPRRNSAEPAPLSYAQKRLWFLDQLDPGSVVYNLRETNRRRGRFDIPVLVAALNEVVRRHEILRTTFETIDGRAVQIVAPAQAVALPLVDLSALPEPEKEARQLMYADGSRSFDLARGPLFRVTVLKLAEEDHIIVLTMHHISFDGWSIGVFMKEVAALCNAFSQGLPSPLPELPVQYADYAVWQRAWLRGEVLGQHIGYWKKQLEGAPELLLLPTDRPRPAVQTHSGANVGMVLSQKLTAKLHELCRAEGATPYMLLLAVFKVLLARYTGQEDISVGTPIAGRNRVETENLIGCFLNTLVLRTDLTGNPTARELVQRVREVALGAYAHQEVPFEKLLDELRVARSLSHSPLFQVMFNMVNFPGGEFDLRETESPDLDSISSKIGSQTPLDVRSKFDLTLYVNDRNDGIQFTLIYNPDLFRRERIVEMLDQFKHLLAQVSDDPSIEITRLSLVTPSSAKLLPEPTQPIYSHWSGAVHQLFAEHARKSPDRFAVTDKQETWTYGEIERRSNQLANYLRACGIQRQDVVAIYAHRSATLVWAIYGILKAGATFLILDPAYPELRLIDYLRAAKPRGWLQLEEAGALPPALNDFVESLSCCANLTLQTRATSEAQISLLSNSIGDGTADTLAEYSVDDPRVEIGPDDIACITFTSGSSGTPKGVLGRHLSLTLFANWTQKEFAINEDDRFSMLSGLAHDPVQRDIFTPLQLGASLSIPDPKEIGTPGWLARWMKLQGISVTNLTPAMGQVITETAGDDELPSLRHAFFVGDILTRRDVGRLKKLAPSVTSINLYGTTETQRAVGFFVDEQAASYAKEELPVGRGIDGVQLLVLNAAGQLAGIGELGEIYFRSPYLALGYNDDELTQHRFLTNPFTGIQNDRLYKTGDVGRYLPDGNVEMVGRMDHQVKIRGFRIELGEIESAIAEHPAVQACAVLAREDQPGDKRLVAYLVFKHDFSVTTAELRSTLKKRLPDYMVPAHFVVLDELPLTPNGKLNRLALPAPVASRDSLTHTFISPRTPVEEVLAGIWCDVLRTTGIGVDDNFFELGGHSLLGTQVVSRIREAFSIEISVRALFENQTIAMLAAEVERLMYQGGSLQAPPVVRTSREVELPLSFAQQRLWFIDRLIPESPLYNMPMAVRLDGTLKLDALERTLREIVRRHEVLRTSFVTVEGKPVQVIRPETYVDEIYLPLVDLSSLSGGLRDVEAKRLARAEAARPFDLETDALLRTTVLRLDEHQHIALLTFHHIIFDGWSIGVFVREVAALYNAFSQGLESPLAELPVQYADYAVWQREWLQGEVLEQHIGYWKQQLEGVPELLELPTDRPRPAVQTHHGAKVAMVLSKKLAGELRELCRAEGATLFMLLLAMFKVLLARYTGQEDISVGTPIAGRNRVETEGLLGFFVNTLVMRTHLSGNPTARELLRRVREVALGAYAHQELPFEKLVEELQVERSLSHMPLFQVLFILQNTSEELLELPGLSLSAAGETSGVAQCDLTLSMSESGEAISGMWEYNTDLFDETTIRRLVGHFKTLLESFVADPAQHLSELQMLTEAERQLTLSEWSEASDEAAALEVSECVQEMFSQTAARYRNNTAIIYQDKQYSYGELDDRANTIANYLIARGAQKGSFVGILAKDSFHVISSIIGILKAGCVFIPFDRQLPQQRLAAMVSLVAPEWFIIESRFWDILSSVTVEAAPQATVICVDGDPVANGEEHLVQAVDYKDYFNPEKPSVESDADDMAYIYFTSGSTGQPKAIAGRLQGIDHFIRWELETLGVGEGVRVSRLLPISFDASLRDIFLPLCTGGIAIGPAPRDTVLQAGKLVEWLEEHEINVIHCVPSLFRSLVNEVLTPERLPALKHILMSGEPLLPSDVGRWMDVFGDRIQLINLYGPSETTMTKFVYFVQPADRERASIPIGKPMAGANAVLVNAKGHPSEPGTIGEIYIRTPYRSLGYYNQPELTRESFIADPFGDNSGEIVYKTGDLARLLEDGNYEFLGRKDQQVKIRGIRVELSEIESLLRGHEGVRDVAVIDRDDANGFKYLCAYVVFEDEAETNPAGLRDYLATYLPDYMLPSSFVPMQELPRTISGKLDRRALPAPGQSRAGLETYVAPRTPVEEVLAGIWSEVLRTTRIGVNDNFFELSGHSLLAMQVVSRVGQAFGVEIFVRAIFENQTIAKLAVQVERLMYQGGSLQAAPLVRTSREVELPLSFAQQRLWFIDRFEPGSPLYNMPMAVRLDGALNLAALERTLREIVRRHEVLRTSFVDVKGKPVQVIRPEAHADEIYLPLVDLSSLPEASREVESKRLARAEAIRPFDLETDALLRTTVLRLDAAQHIALLTFHHIIFDGWSMGVFVKEVAALYNAFSQGQASPLAELPVQYADYAVWQQEWLQGEVLDQQIGYWKQQLEGAPELLELPTDRPRPAVQTHRGARVGMVLSQELTAKLREVCRAEGVTLFMLVLAVFKVLLARYTGQEDISVGTPIAGRNRVETESLIGFFVNTLVLRTDLSGNPSARELLRRVREVALGAYAHQELPFEKLVDELQVERSLSHAPLFQVLFVLQNTSEELLELPGLRLSAAGAASGVAKYDLTLNVSESAEAISGALEYNTDLFDETTIRRLVGHFETLLESFVSDPAQRLSELQLLTEAERQRTLCEWSKGSDEVATEASECLQDLFEAQVERTPEAIALVFDEKETSYRELNSRANQLAHYLQSIGVREESLVGILVERSVEMLVGILGVLKAGAAYVPLDPTYPQERLSFMVADAGVEVLLTQRHLAERFEARSFETLCLDRDWPQIAEQATDNPARRSVAANAAYVIYTSGSTGQPKGVVVPHAGAVNLGRAWVDPLGVRPGTRVLQCASLSFDISVAELLVSVMFGATLCVPKPETQLAGTALHELLQQQSIEILLITPTALATIERDDLPSLRTLVVGGEVCTTKLAARWSTGRRFINAYGPTEITVTATMSEPLNGERQPPIGRPLANMQAYVLDKYMEPVAVGVPGELYVGGVGVTRGYLHRPELTAEKFLPHPYSEQAGARLYRTGDLVRWRADGELEYLGRIDDQVKIRGFRIELGEIANALREQAGVRECVVLALGEGGEEKRLVAYVVANEGVNTAELREGLKQRLPHHMIPAAIVLLDEMPLAKSGKVDRRALPAPEEVSSEVETNFVAPRTPIEEVLAGVWSEVLRTTRIGVDDNFFDLGGHSLLAMQLVSRIREALGVEIPVRTIFEKQTLAMLAAEVEQLMYQGGSLQAAPIVRTSREVELPLSFAQQRLWFIDRLTPESPLYNMPMAVRLDGTLNLAALERTLREIVRRHEVLRTNIVTVEGKPVQVIRPETYVDEIHLPLVDLSLLPEALREEKSKQLARAEAVRPFDLETDALLRATVLRQHATQHIALLTFHHIVTDGWSMGVFVKEVAALYNAFSQGLDSPLAELPVQYADYAVWQREWLQGEVLEQHIGYWKQQLEDAPELLELPTDRPRPAVQTHRGANVGTFLSPELTAKLRELCRAEGVTLFMVLLAALKVLLARYTGQEDISVGTPIAGRNRVETESLIGFFVNTLVLRTDLSGNPSARELVRRVREVALGAYAHQELPFEKLVDELQVERSLDHTPLFQVLFALQNNSEELLELPGLRLSAAGAASGVAKYDLTLNVSESDEAISGAWEYNTDLFDETTIRRLAGHFNALLESFVSDPAQRLSQLQLLTDAELQRTLYEWSEVKDEAAGFEISECLHDSFEAQVERTPDAIALVFAEQEISYRELNSRANQLAHHLQSHGVREESLVGILVERSVEMLVGILAVLKAGAAYVPLDPTYPQERLSFMVADAGVEVLLTQQHLAERFEARSFETLCLDRDWAQIAEQATDNPARRSVATNTAYVIYTSGSTGRPKGVVVPHAGALNLADAQRRAFDVRPATRVLQFASLSFDASVSEIFVTLLCGATLCLAKPDTQLAGPALHELMQQQAIEVVTLPPTVLATLESDELPSLRTVITAGEACTAEMAARWSAAGRRFINAYGPTETTVCATMSEPLDGECQPPIGRPMTNMQTFVLDRYMQPVAVGVVGELYVGGAGVTRGYLRRPELTAEKFVPHPFSLEGGARLYRTGDFARYLADGQLEYIGRIDEQVKVRGFRIELQEIEAVLLQHEQVREAVVVARADESGERRLVAYLVTHDDDITTSQPTASELRLHVKQCLPDYMVPSAFVQLESFPVTPAGKVDKERLPALTAQRPSLASEYVKPQSETEQRIAAVWQELLHVSEIGTEDNFFDLGGNSLLLVQVHARLQKIFGAQLTMVDLFEHSTISSLAAKLSHEEPAAQAELQAARFEKRMTGKQRQRQRLEKRKRVA